jgi:hypothetical protein
MKKWILRARIFAFNKLQNFRDVKLNMKPSFRKTNHLAIAGFLLPFVAAGAASAYVLYCSRDYTSLLSKAVFMGLIPLILVAGLYASLRSLPLIAEKGDKDYAYSGLVLNVFFILLYLSSLTYVLLRFSA